MSPRTLIIAKSIHHNNTLQIANKMSKILGADVIGPEDVDQKDISDYDLIGFGSGIYSGKHHGSLFKLINKMTDVSDKKAFIFSTNGAPAIAADEGHVEEYLEKNHSKIKGMLESKGYEIIDEFSCPGWNTNLFLKLFGGINKGRPNSNDLQEAEVFAGKLLKNMNGKVGGQ